VAAVQYTFTLVAFCNFTAPLWLPAHYCNCTALHTGYGMIYSLNAVVLNSRRQLYSTHLHLLHSVFLPSHYVYQRYMKLYRTAHLIWHDISVNCSCVDTRWQQYSTHLHLLHSVILPPHYGYQRKTVTVPPCTLDTV